MGWQHEFLTLGRPVSLRQVLQYFSIGIDPGDFLPFGIDHGTCIPSIAGVPGALAGSEIEGARLGGFLHHDEFSPALQAMAAPPQVGGVANANPAVSVCECQILSGFATQAMVALDLNI
jgi:hypothetical protein